MPRPAGLKDYQEVLEPGVLYSVWAQPSLSRIVADGSAAQLAPSIEIVGDTSNVRGSQIDPGDTPTDMPVMFANLEGISAFTVVPNYLHVDGTPTSIVLSGVRAIAIKFLAAATEIEMFVDAPLILD